MRLDSAGNKIWHKCLGGDKMDVAEDAFAFSNGDLFLAGNNSSVDGDVQNHIGADGSLNIWVLRTDTAGNIKWQKCYGVNPAMGFTCIAQDSVGQVWATGTSQGKSIPLSDTAFGGLCDATVWRLDTFGNVTGQRVIGTPQTDIGLFIAPMAGNVVLAGGNYAPPVTNETTPSDTTSFNSVYFNIIGNWTTEISTPTIAEKLLTLYPNPAKENITIVAPTKCKIRITDIAGREVYRGKIKDKIEICVQGWAKGIYLLESESSMVQRFEVL